MYISPINSIIYQLCVSFQQSCPCSRLHEDVIKWKTEVRNMAKGDITQPTPLQYNCQVQCQFGKADSLLLPLSGILTFWKIGPFPGSNSQWLYLESHWPLVTVTPAQTSLPLCGGPSQGNANTAGRRPLCQTWASPGGFVFHRIRCVEHATPFHFGEDKGVAREV